jgi:S-(hydroxymethyl)glutathione dehydrogenase/alcohol dehydrogenase
MALACAKLRGAARVIAIDGDAYRLEFARTKIGAEVIDFTKEDVLKALKERCPNGPDVCIDSAGFRFPKSMTERLTRVLSVSQRDTADILRECIFAVRKGGT